MLYLSNKGKSSLKATFLSCLKLYQIPFFITFHFVKCCIQTRIFLWKSLLLLLSRFSRVRLCVTPQTAAHQAPQSLRFSRQEHWSGLPFPSPMHESEKWKWSRSVVSDSSQPHGLQPTRLPSMGFSRQEHWSGLPFPSPMHESRKWKWSRSVMS